MNNLKDAIYGQRILYLTYISIIVFLYIFCIMINISKYIFYINALIGLVLICVSTLLVYFKHRRISNKYNNLTVGSDLSETIAQIKSNNKGEEQAIADAVIKICNEYWVMFKDLKQANITEDEYINLWIHEIKIPLSNIKLKLEQETDYEHVKEVEKIEDYISKILFMKHITNAENKYTIKQIDTTNALNAVIKNFKSHIIYNQIELRIDTDHSSIYTDQFWFKFIVSQLISNSIKYEASKISIVITENKIEIIDNGIGIESKETDMIFDKFFIGTRTKDVYKSSGMGLYIVHQLCNDLNISISAECFDNKTVFTLIFD